MQLQDSDATRFSALQINSPSSNLVVLLNFRVATPFEKSIEQVLDLHIFLFALNQVTEMSGVPAIWQLRVRASPADTSEGFNSSTK